MAIIFITSVHQTRPFQSNRDIAVKEIVEIYFFYKRKGHWQIFYFEDVNNKQDLRLRNTEKGKSTKIKMEDWWSVTHVNVQISRVLFEKKKKHTK